MPGAISKLSVIVPAYNEERELPFCLPRIKEALQEASRGTSLDWELIVTDNNSTDGTAEVAHRFGAKVVFEPHNQIARARNVGASVATGDWFLFVDADSRLHPDSIREMFTVIGTGRCGAGGCLVRMDDAPWWGRLGVRFWNTLSRLFRWAAGSFVFCRADAFRDVGGFNEEYFAAEELYFSQALKAWCRGKGLGFVILRRQPHVSSARKFHIYSLGEIGRLMLAVTFAYRQTVRDKRALDFFYDGRR